ncbi:TIGR03986 family type III CRISPR-associated RAMP protein [Streptomyces albogriseolus]|uniref:TIGR03986 family type III CRISPR-associated RAMP protein n=1 Tax=Streptomyces albogriseolus TaxID=1887 RepID=UPI003CF3A66B
MADADSGELRWKDDAETGQKRLVLVEDDSGRSRTVKRPRMFAPAMAAYDESGLDGLRVHYDRHKGQPANIRPHGTAAPRPEPKPALERPVSAEEFVNPYTFIPARPRTSGIPADLADRRPEGHHRIRPDRWTGRIAVTLTCATPLLLLDTARPVEGPRGHFTYPVPRHADGSPLLPATSVKGMLRAAYEAVTNSRFGVFAGHDERLGYRRPVGTAQRMRPARVSDDGEHIELLAAALLPRYRPSDAVAYPDGTRPEHGDYVTAVVARRNGKSWKVVPRTLKKRPVPDRASAVPLPTTTEAGRQVHGWVFATNQNINNKRSERIFYPDPSGPPAYRLTDAHKAEWEKLILDYRAAHRPADIHERKKDGGGRAAPDEYLGDDPGDTAWSPHQYDDAWLRLTPGTLCYAQVENGRLQGLYPVMISRGLFAKPPADLLDPSLHPASHLDGLSPADRVFGWTNPSGPGAYRGQLRIGPVTCQTPSDEAIEEFQDTGLPLAVLSTPKPQQGRFYLSHHRNAPHKPLPDGTSKTEWFTGNQGLRGRKTYWHHATLPDGYWDNPTEDRTGTDTPTGHHQEYRRPDGERLRDDQNRSVRGWIRPGTCFRLTLDVDNLTDLELGALAWLLTLEDGHFHRLGHGKPLGFGSVHLAVDPADTALHRGEDWRTYYRTLNPALAPEASAEPSGALLERLATGFAEQARKAAIPDGAPGAADAPELDAFRAATRGVPGYAVHYPRLPDEKTGSTAPHPEGESYKWFVENDRAGGGGRSLPAWHDPVLPFSPEQTESSAAGPSNNRNNNRHNKANSRKRNHP